MHQISQLMIAAGLLNLLVGVGYTAVVYTTLEKVPALAGVLGFSLAIGIILVQAWFGEAFLSVSVAEMKQLVMVAVACATIGIASITTVFEPTTS